MKKLLGIFAVSAVAVFAGALFATAQQAEITEADIERGLGEARAMQAQIENECRKDPHACSCQNIPCENILQVDHPRKNEAYSRCAEERSGCEAKRQDAIRQIEEIQSKIEVSCRKNINACSCDEIDNNDGRKKCELAVIEAKYQAEKQRQDKIRQCSENIDTCDCSDIADEAGKTECENKIAEVKKFKAEIEAACRENPINCDCTAIEQESGRKQCEDDKQKGLAEAEDNIKKALSTCFKNVETCDCSALGLEKQEYISFCQIQKSYGLNCKREGTNCDKLENVEIYPPGMPPWLGTLFAKSYKDYVEKEKAQGAKTAAGIIAQCLESATNCRCEATPSYARAFCEKNKALQIKCESGDYDACIVLDQAPNLPEGVPSFSYSLLDRAVASLRGARKMLVQGNAARKVGNMILSCMDSSANCDCSLAPSGSIKSFCEHKKGLVNLCREKKNYDACFTLHDEANYPVETPDIIKSYIQKNIVPQIKTKEQRIFDEMKKGTVCANIATLEECRKIYYVK
jgi:hypothetical protein